jgi:hypothetical protein
MKFYKLIFVAVAMLFVSAGPAAAQSSGTLNWTIGPATPGVTFTLAMANSYQYREYVDALPSTLLSATCTGTVVPFACSAPTGTQPVGAHTVSITATDNSVTPPFETPHSATIPFVIPAPSTKPGTPGTLTITIVTTP